MNIKMTKIENLEVGTLYADSNGKFFKIYQPEDAESPRDREDNIATLFTWEDWDFSIDKREISLDEFAKKQGIDVSKQFHCEDLIRAMKKNGYVVLPIYALYHGDTHYSVHDFGDRWDSGMVGVGFCKKINGTPAEESWMRGEIEKEVDEYDGWANGQTYDLAVFDEHEDFVENAGERLILKDWERNVEQMILDAGINLQPEYREAEREVSVSLR